MRKMYQIVAIALTLLISVPVFAQSQQAREEMALGAALPAIELSSTVYGNITPADLKGKVVLVCMFATWCGPCQHELAEVQKVLWPKYGKNENFKLIVIGREHTDEELTKYNAKKGFDFPLYPDPQRKVYSKFADSTIPRSYLFNKNGKLVYSSIGYKAEEFEKLMDAISKALK